MRDKFWKNWQLWPKNVITQIFQSLYNFIFALDNQQLEMEAYVLPNEVINDNVALATFQVRFYIFCITKFLFRG